MTDCPGQLVLHLEARVVICFKALARNNMFCMVFLEY
jgi:hypothetical protein